MAITVERMIAVLEANNAKFDKAIAASAKLAVDEFGRVIVSGTAMENKLGGMGPKAARGLNQVTKAVGGLQQQTGNLAAQFNDIGVQLAGGQSPFLIALQQGTQISQVLGQQGARAAVSSLGAAFLSLLNPVSLATIAVITLGGTIYTYFTAADDGTEKANKKLKEHADHIRTVTGDWGEAVPQLKAYQDQVDRMKSASDLRLVGGELAAKDLEALNAEFQTFLDDQDDVVTALNLAYDATGRNTSSLGELATQWQILLKKIHDGTATQEDFRKASILLGVAAKESGGDLDEFGKSFDSISGRIINALSALQQFQRAMNDALITAKKVQTDIQSKTSGQINNPNLPDPNFRLPTESFDPGHRPLFELEGGDEAKKAAKEKVNEFQRATESVEDRTKALDAQRQAQEAVNPLINDYGFAMEQAKTKADLLVAAEKAKIELTPEVVANIDKISAAYAKANADLAKLAETQKLAAEAVAFQKNLLSGVLDDMRSALEDGKLDWQDLGNMASNVLNKIADKLQSMLIDQLFAAAAPGGAGGIVGAISTALGLGATVAAGAASGGSSAATGSSVGSAPATPSAASMGAAQSVSVESSIRVDEDGNWQARVEKISGAVAAGQGQAGLEHYRRNQMRVDVNRIAASPRVRGTT